MVCLIGRTRKRILVLPDWLRDRSAGSISCSMTNAMDWKGVAGRSWADEWRRTDRSFGPLTAQLMARIAQEPGRRVLDIGCGAGELSLGIAAARPDAEVRGMDISPELLAAANGRANLPNVRFELADASQWSDPAFVPDLMVSRHGVMFFDDPAAAFAAGRAAAARAAAEQLESDRRFVAELGLQKQ